MSIHYSTALPVLAAVAEAGVEEDGCCSRWMRCSSSACSSIDHCGIRRHRYKRAGHRRMLRRHRQRPPFQERRGAALQVQRHRQHALLLRRPGAPQRAARLGHRPRPRRRQRQGRRPRRQPRQRRVLGAGQRAGLLPGRQLQVHRRRERGARGGLGAPGHAERPRRPRVGRARRRHQGVHGGEDGRDRQLLAALQRRVQGPLRDVAHRAVPGRQRCAAAGQRVPVLRLRVQPGHRPQLRAVPAELNDGGRPRQRAHLHEPLRRHGGRRPRRAGQGRRRQRRRRGVRERVAVRRREGRHRGQRADVQPEPDQPCRQGHAEEAGADGGVRVRHVQRGPEGRGPHGEEVWAVQSGQDTSLHN